MEALKSLIANIRAQGWAQNDQELEEGLVSLAAPIRDRSGRVVAAVNVSGQAQHTTVDHMLSRYLPRLLASGSVNLRGFDHAPTTFNYDVGVVLDVPLFTGFLVDGQVQELEARMAEVKAREAMLQTALDYQERQAREGLKASREAVAASEAQVEAAQTGLTLAETRYKQGLGTLVELTDAEAQLDAAQAGLLQSRLDVRILGAQYDYARGALGGP